MLEACDKAAQVLHTFADVRLAYLFGSLARGELRPASDVDVAVLARPDLTLDRYGEIRDALAAALDRHVDLVDLAKAPPLLVRKVIGNGRVLVCRSEREQAEFEMRAMARYLDTRHLRELQYAYLCARIEERRAS